MFQVISNKAIHFVGIGGIGMSGVAKILASLGHKVTGSDINDGPICEELRSVGIEIFKGHHIKNVQNALVVVTSTAISNDNPEVNFALKHQIPVIKRAEMLAELMRLKYGIAVAGSHGKTTTSSMLATIMNELEYDPTHVIGGVVTNLGSQAKEGKGQFIVVEADESDGSFLLLNPVVTGVTNIDNDHLDFYQDQRSINQAFIDFCNKIPFYGLCVLNLDDQNIKEIRPFIKRPVLSYGIFEEENIEKDLIAKNIKQKNFTTFFQLYYKGQYVGDVNIQVPGRFNVLNSLCALGLSLSIGIDLKKAMAAISKFSGTKRRFQKIMTPIKYEIYEDYGHHPTEISETLLSARENTKKDIVVVFEPHRFSRMKDCWDQFLHCFNHANEVYISDIYPAGERPIPEIHTNRLLEDINKLHPNLAKKIDLDNIQILFENEKNIDDKLYLFMGAGSISKKLDDFVHKFLR